MALTAIAERLAVELSLPILKTWVYCGFDSNIQPSACEANALTDCATAAFQRASYGFPMILHGKNVKNKGANEIIPTILNLSYRLIYTCSLQQSMQNWFFIVPLPTAKRNSRF